MCPNTQNTGPPIPQSAMSPWLLDNEWRWSQFCSQAPLQLILRSDPQSWLSSFLNVAFKIVCNNLSAHVVRRFFLDLLSPQAQCAFQVKTHSCSWRPAHSSGGHLWTHRQLFSVKIHLTWFHRFWGGEMRHGILQNLWVESCKAPQE